MTNHPEHERAHPENSDHSRHTSAPDGPDGHQDPHGPHGHGGPAEDQGHHGPHEHHAHDVPDADWFSAAAATWDDGSHAERSATLAAAIRDAIPLSGKETVLEVGGGTGLLSRALAADIGTALITDVAPGMVEVATQVLDDPQYAGWRTARYDVERDPLLAERFDLVLCQLALHHMGDVATVLGRMFELLRPGGRVAIADLEHDADGGFHRHIEGFHGHHGFTQESLAGGLVGAGFVDVRVAVASELTKEVDGAERTFPVLLATGRRP